MKACLKEWHHQHSHNLNGKITMIKDRISILDSKGETSMLREDELAELHDLSLNLYSLSRTHNSISWQKSRMNWLQEGDANSKYFHSVMANRQRHNAIHMVSVEGVTVEGAQNIRDAVSNHFSTHFKLVGGARPGARYTRPSISQNLFRRGR
jgi:hypothetical protein